MNNERYNQIIDEAYENYEKNTPKQHVVGHDSDTMIQCMVWKRKTDSLSGYPIFERLTKEEFINKCETDSMFSKRWGLKIEERELSLGERMNLIKDDDNDKIIIGYCENPGNEWLKGQVNEILTSRNIPTKLITLTYKDETIEIIK